MSYKGIPEDVGQFIIEKIDSVAQLEALLLLRSSPEEKWSVRALSSRLYIDEQKATVVEVDKDKREIVIKYERGQKDLYVPEQYQGDGERERRR
jgi:hypothetical protein